MGSVDSIKVTDLTGGVEANKTDQSDQPRFQNGGQSSGPPTPGLFYDEAGNVIDAIKDYQLKGSDLVQPTKYTPTNDSSKPSVCMIGWHTCIRVMKESVALANKGWKLGLITNKLPLGRSIFDKVYTYEDDGQLKRALEEVKDKYDLFHVHNEPNVLLIRAREILGDKKIILDAHDFDLLRRGFCGDEEVMAVSHCDGMIHVSEPIRQYINSVYNIQNIPSITLESRCPVDFIPQPQEGMKVPPRLGVVYEGGIRPPENTSDFSYRNIWPICYAFAQSGYSVNYIGPVNAGIKQKYEEAGVRCVGGMEYNSLLVALTRYQWGFSGFLQDPPKKHVEWVMTNKMFEYINCGTPVIVYNTPEQAKIIQYYNIGLVLSSLHNIREQIESVDWAELHENTKRARYEIAMDNHIHKLEELYYRVLN